jgi:hypothetical protein
MARSDYPGVVHQMNRQSVGRITCRIKSISFGIVVMRSQMDRRIEPERLINDPKVIVDHNTHTRIPVFGKLP